METRGQRIARLREAKGFSPYDLQMASGVRESNIRNWEAHRALPRDVDLLKLIADALDVTLEYLVEAPCELEATA